jgi:hypothetical protein
MLAENRPQEMAADGQAQTSSATEEETSRAGTNIKAKPTVDEL